MKALICKQCGAPMQNQHKCDYCGTHYYDDIAEKFVPKQNNVLRSQEFLGSASVCSAYHPSYMFSAKTYAYEIDPINPNARL